MIGQNHNITSIQKQYHIHLKLKIFGLRDLKPLNLLPVKKTYIKFDINSLNINDKEKDSLKAIITLPKDYRSSPTINSVNLIRI